MKLPLESLWGTVISGLVITIVLALIIMIAGPAALWIDLVIVLVVWLGMFGILRKPA